MKRFFSTLIFATFMIFPVSVCAQTSGSTVPPPPYCTSSNPGAIYTNTSTSPATVYTCSYYNLTWQWVINPSYGGLVYYPTLPATCSGALPAFLAGWPNTVEYVCVQGHPQALGGGVGVVGQGTTGQAAIYPSNGNAVQGGTLGLSGGGTGATTASQALANLGGLSAAGGTITGNLNVTGVVTDGGTTTDGQEYQSVTNPPALSGPPVYGASTAGSFHRYNFQGTPLQTARDPTSFGFTVTDSAGGANNGYGNPAGANSWSLSMPINISGTHWGAGQFIASENLNQYGMGDFAGRYNTMNWALGVQAGADEGGHNGTYKFNEDPTLFSGTVTTPPASGGNAMTINSSAGYGHQGANRMLLDLTAPIATGNIVTHTSGSGFTPESYTVTITSGTIASSTAQGTLVSSCGPGSTQLNLGSQTTPSTCTVAVGSGTFASGNYDSFAGTWHETAEDNSVTAPSGGQQTISLNLHEAHEAGSWVMEGGVSGSCIVFTANIGDGFKYPLTVLGASGTTIYTRAFAFSLGTSVSSYSGNLIYTGSGASSAFTIYPCAQVTDPQGPAQVTPPQVAGPTTPYVEPTPWPWTAGDAVEEEHDPGWRLNAYPLALTIHNPCALIGGFACFWNGYSVALSGAGMLGNGFGNFQSSNGGSTRAGFYVENDNTWHSGVYNYQKAPSAFRVNGPFDEVMGIFQAPRGGLFPVGCPFIASGGSDVSNCASTTPYYIFQLAGGPGSTSTVPLNMTWTSGTSLYSYSIGSCTYTYGPNGATESGTGCVMSIDASGDITTPGTISAGLSGMGTIGNLETYSWYDSGSIGPSGGTAWTGICGSTWTTASSDSAVDPLLGSTAATFTAPSSWPGCAAAAVAQNVTSQLTIGQTYTQSAYLKGAAGGEVVSVSMYSTDGTYTAMQASYTLSATQWTRVQATGTITSAVSGKTMQAGWGTSTLGATIYAWQPQLVVGTGPGLCTHTTSTTTAVSQGIVDQCQIMPLPNTILTSNSSVSPAVPAWLQYLSTGADGANTNASGNMNGEYYYTNFTVPYGNTVNVNYAAGLTIHATGTCTIAGTIEANGATAGSGGGYPIASSGGGGSGGGAAAGTAGQPYYITVNIGTFGGGTAGALSGGNGSNGGTVSTSYKRIALASGGSTDGQFMYGGAGKTGGSSGGAGGNGGASVVLICGSIVGTDGTHTGIIDASGQAGSNATANSTGAGSGGGGGVVILSSQSTVTTWPTINTSGGAGGTCGAFTTCGTGGAGGAGWSAEFQGW